MQIAQNMGLYFIQRQYLFSCGHLNQATLHFPQVIRHRQNNSLSKSRIFATFFVPLRHGTGHIVSHNNEKYKPTRLLILQLFNRLQTRRLS